MSKTPPPTFLPFPSPTIAKASFDAFWSDVRAAMERNNIPHLTAAVAVGSFPEYESVGQGKDHKHELDVLTSIRCIGNDNQIHNWLAGVLLRTIINVEHEDIEKRYQELVCGSSEESSSKSPPTPTKKRTPRGKRQ